MLLPIITACFVIAGAFIAISEILPLFDNDSTLSSSLRSASKVMFKVPQQFSFSSLPYASILSSPWQLDVLSGIESLQRARDNDWNLLYHLGGNGPWIEKVDGVVEGGTAPREGCVVEQVHMVWKKSCCQPPKVSADNA